MQVSVQNQHAKVIVDVAIQMEKAVNDMKSQFSKLNLGSDISRQFETAFKGLGSNLTKIMDLGGKSQLNTSEIERLSNLSKTVEGQFSTLTQRFEELGQKGGSDLRQLSPEFAKLIKFIRDTASATTTYTTKLTEIKSQQNANNQELEEATKQYDELNQKLATQKAELQEYQRIQNESGNQGKLQELKGRKAQIDEQVRSNDELIQRYENLDSVLKKFGTSLKDIGNSENPAQEWSKAYEDLGKWLEEARSKLKLLNKEQNTDISKKPQQTALKAEIDAAARAQAQIPVAQTATETVAGTDMGQAEGYAKQIEYQQTLQIRANQATKAIEQQQQVVNSENAVIEEQQEKVADLQSQTKTAEQQAKGFSDKQQDLQKKLDNLKQPDIETLREKLQDLANISLDEVPTDLNGIVEKQRELAGSAPENFVNTVRQLGEEARNQGSQAKGFDRITESMRGTAQATKETNDQMDMFKSRIKYFFSAYSAVQMLRRAVQQTFQTVKELDSAMTEIAVVTDFSVGDMWDQLPKYTDEANKLGISIDSMYKSTQLFYQQGLKTDQVFQLSEETMRMARIAGLDAAEATNRMTAQLRAFNMELNQTSAQNVADVYSQLAAMSASNVNELSSAMSKTSSIAQNAGASFENTAAFLAQIIKNMVTCSSNAA